MMEEDAAVLRGRKLYRKHVASHGQHRFLIGSWVLVLRFSRCGTSSRQVEAIPLDTLIHQLIYLLYVPGHKPNSAQVHIEFLKIACAHTHTQNFPCVWRQQSAFVFEEVSSEGQDLMLKLCRLHSRDATLPCIGHTPC